MPEDSAGNYQDVPGVLAKLQDSVLRLTLDRAASRNAIDDVMLDALIRHVAAAGQDEDVRVVLIDTSGPDFCTGADLIARNVKTDRKPRVGSTQRRLPTKAHRLIPLLTETQTPIVCSVKGWVAGLGLHIALAADFCVASDDAKFWEPFMARGFTPDSGGAWLLPRLIGLARARRLLMLGEELSGRQAADWGIVHEACPADCLDTTTDELVSRLAAAPTVALGLTKWLLHGATDLDLDRHLHNEALALELSSRSEDFREGLAAFREKRDARFVGR